MAQFPGMKTVRIQDRPAQVYRGDLCVVGSGAGGISAALEAARLGQQVVLVDAAPGIGGQAVGAALGTICGLFRNGPVPKRLTHGVMDALFDTLFARGDAALRRVRGTFILDYVPNAWMRWAETEVANAGIVPLPGAIVRRVEQRDGIVEALALSTRFGDARVEANRFVDASGDAVLPWLAGQELRESEKPVLGTVMAILEDVDTGLCAGYPRSLYHDLIRRYGDEFGLVRAEGPVFVVPGTRKLLLNLTHVETPMETAGLALAGIEGRRQVDALLSLFKRELPEAFRDAKVAVYGNAGIRQTRTIVGRSHVTVENVATGARPPDAIARTTWPIELHGDMAGAHWTLFDDNHIHYIPFGAMLPRGLHNVVVAGRCIDAEPAALASLRVMGPCFAMGRAAATAAHLNASGSLHQIDIAALQDAVNDNLTHETTDPWAREIVSETGPEAEGNGGVGNPPMKQIEPDLWQSAIHRSGILNSHAYFLTRPDGNVLFYNTGDEGDLAQIEGLGGIRYQLLTHRDEAAPSLKRIGERFGAVLCCSAPEAPAAGKHAPVDIVFGADDRRPGEIDVLHTPGHTDGSLCFFYRSPHGKAYLFSGDTIFHWNGKWATLVLSKAGGSKAALAESLLRLREIDPDLVMSSGFVGDVAMAAVTRDEWTEAIDSNVRRLKSASQ